MYAEKDLNRARSVLERIAGESGLPETEIRSQLLEAMDTGRSDPRPEPRALWASFSYAGPEPTAEEFILWAASLVSRA